MVVFLKETNLKAETFKRDIFAIRHILEPLEKVLDKKTRVIIDYDPNEDFLKISYFSEDDN
jgi:hypothetical protein